VVPVRGRARATRVRVRRFRGWPLRFGGRGCATRAASRARPRLPSLSGAGGYSARAACQPGSPRSSWRRWSGAVTITPRSCPSASRRTSTALRCAISSAVAPRVVLRCGEERASRWQALPAPSAPRRASRLCARASLSSRRTADLELRLAAAGERTRLLRRARRGTHASTRFQGRQRGDASARGLLPAQKITSVDAVQSRSRAGSRRLPAGACTPRRPRSPRSPRRGGRHEHPHPCGSTAGAAR
jgi:hypothetical protein